VAERILSASELGADRTSAATSQETIKAIRETVKTDDSFEECQHKCLFYCADNAADESLAGDIAGKELLRMTFKMSDSSHSLMLAIKNGCKGDPEVDAVQGIFLTNKKPYPSIANMLRHSKRFRASFTEEQQDAVFASLSHLGWAPQRMTSRARSYRRGALTIDGVFKALAKEAEGGARKEAALHNIQELSKFNRLMIAGMLADLTVEHQQMVRPTDTADPDPVEVPQLMRQFAARVDLLFIKGEVLRMEYSFTAQIIRFLQKPSLLLVKKLAVLFATPAGQTAKFEPLERMRAIVGNVLVCLQAALPENSWQVQFSCFFLPSPLGPARPGRPAAKALARKRFLSIFQAAGHKTPEKTFEEVLELMPHAEKHSRDGVPHRHAWAAASVEYPTLSLARDAVSLYLGCGHSTGNVERLLKLVALREHERSSQFVNDIMLCTHAPKVKDVAFVADGHDRSRSIVPRGTYLPRILKAYGAIFGGRAWSKAPKARRDKDVARPIRDTANVTTEAAFMRKREAEIRSLEHAEKSGAVQKKPRTAFGAEIPADSGAFVTDAIKKVRSDARAREEAKKAGPAKGAVDKYLDKHAKKERMKHEKRWIGKADSSGQTLAPTQIAAASQKRNKYFVWVCGDLQHQDTLSRRGYHVLSRWPQYAKRCVASKKAWSQGIVVLRALHADTLSQDLDGLLARIFGGYITTSAWFAAAMSSKASRPSPPEGFYVTGLCFHSASVHLSDALKDKHQAVQNAFRVLAHHCASFTLCDTAGQVMEAVNKYVAERGIRSRPWRKYAILTVDNVERDRLAADVAQPRIVQTLDAWLASCSLVQRGGSCPGW